MIAVYNVIQSACTQFNDLDYIRIYYVFPIETFQCYMLLSDS